MPKQTKSTKSTAAATVAPACVYRTVSADTAGGLVHQMAHDPLTAPRLTDWLTKSFPPAFIPNGEQRKRIRGKCCRARYHHAKNTGWFYTADLGATMANTFPYFRHCLDKSLAKISADKFGALPAVTSK